MLSPLLRSFHDGIFVVTTPNAVERHENIRREIGAEGVELVYSIDRNTVTKENLIADGVYDEEAARLEDPKDRVMSVGEICCSVGHLRAYKRIVETGCRRALVFEDDVVNLNVPEDVVGEILEHVPADADIIQWGWNGGRFPPTLGILQKALSHVNYALGRSKHNHRRVGNMYMRRYNKHFHVAAVNFLAHAYTVSGTAAENLIEYNTPVRLPADHVLIHAILDELVRGYVPVTQLFGQRSIDASDPMPSTTERYT
jgi:GR25 family glycosyltransferase involved in LPS biosynthesis